MVAAVIRSNQTNSLRIRARPPSSAPSLCRGYRDHRCSIRLCQTWRGWRNGRRGGLKIPSGQPGAGSSPAPRIFRTKRRAHQTIVHHQDSVDSPTTRATGADALMSEFYSLRRNAITDSRRSSASSSAFWVRRRLHGRTSRSDSRRRRSSRDSPGSSASRLVPAYWSASSVSVSAG